MAPPSSVNFREDRILALGCYLWWVLNYTYFTSALTHVVLHFLSSVILCLCWCSKVRKLLKTVRPHTETIRRIYHLSYSNSDTHFFFFSNFGKKKKKKRAYSIVEIYVYIHIHTHTHIFSVKFVISWANNKIKKGMEGMVTTQSHNSLGEVWIHITTLSSVRQHSACSEFRTHFPRLEHAAKAGWARKREDFVLAS